MVLSATSPIPAAIERAADWWVDANLADHPGRRFTSAQRRRLRRATEDAMTVGALIAWGKSNGLEATAPKEDAVFDGLWKGMWTTMAADLEHKKSSLLDPGIVQEMEKAVLSMTTSLMSLSVFARRGVHDDEIGTVLIMIRGAILAGFCMEIIRRTPGSELAD